ncbi:tol-pal system protein YbgF [Candidatus Vallotiella sp. (ex Adelges kitamiensis)]|uniref:tol-pal system protein YbgF n=1 Tax=Candidatus Vallotiella sp. (ex Adelges kitamiensis) TaxID=2864217 RepID=UPI001CE364FE|nr:tol-pal system protein YbgF [Candidatus Vallotia sp. (ex Adelges kitamiensis)]
MNVRFSRPKIAIAVAVTSVIFSALPAHASLFSDNETRQAVVNLRATANLLSNQILAVQRAIFDQVNCFEQLNQQVAILRGKNEDLINQVTVLQTQQHNYYTDLDSRLKKLECHQKMISRLQGKAQSSEADEFNAALQLFKKGHFKSAASGFKAFSLKYPNSLYQPTSQYWLGNALYAQRKYKLSTLILRGIVTKYPTHPRAPEALFAIANNQWEQGRKNDAKRTLKQILSQYKTSNAAQAAQKRLLQIQ